MTERCILLCVSIILIISYPAVLENSLWNSNIGSLLSPFIMEHLFSSWTCEVGHYSNSANKVWAWDGVDQYHLVCLWLVKYSNPELQCLNLWVTPLSTQAHGSSWKYLVCVLKIQSPIQIACCYHQIPQWWILWWRAPGVCWWICQQFLLYLERTGEAGKGTAGTEQVCHIHASHLVHRKASIAFSFFWAGVSHNLSWSLWKRPAGRKEPLVFQYSWNYCADWLPQEVAPGRAGQERCTQNFTQRDWHHLSI